MEEWTRWQPAQGLSKKYTINSLTWSELGVIITLSDYDNRHQAQVVFENFVDAYRYTDQSYYSKKLTYLADTYGKDFYENWSFFKVTHSDYVQWIIEKSYESNFIHFCIVGNNKILDIVNGYEPEIKIIEQKRINSW